jgi:N,N'-diacetyllegionaminate synthase
MRRTFVIAEAGVNHNGSVELALQLVDTAARCGVDAIKFQTFTADKLVRRGAAKVAYQQATTGDGDQHSMLAALELTEEMHHALFERCAQRGIEFMSTPFDAAAADYLVALGMRRIKIPSGEITNHPFLRHLARMDVQLILSTGMATLEEVVESTAVIRSERSAAGLNRPLSEMLTVLHCTSNYPAAYIDVNLRAMRTIADTILVPVGYSDHSLGIAVSTAAVALGATVVEKHFTLDKAMSGPDHHASLLPDELAAMVQQIRAVEQALGDPCKQPTPSELPVRELVRRSVTSSCDLTAGEPLSHDDICLLRPGTGITPRDFDRVVGLKLRRSVPAGTTLQWSDFE